MNYERRGTRLERGFKILLILIISISILLIAFFFRIYALDLKPFHHDEGVNARFLMKLMERGVYRYNPKSYHGPTLFFLTLPVAKKLGLSDRTLRIPVTTTGILSVAMLLILIPFGSRIVFYSALLLAISPMDIFYSRTFIHETLLIFFTLCVFISLSYLLIEKKPLYLYLLALFSGLAFATKETYSITVFSLGVALLIEPTLNSLLTTRSIIETIHGIKRAPQKVISHLMEWKFSYLLALLIFFLTIFTFFTSFFTFFDGFGRFFYAFILWFKEGQEHHKKEFFYYGGLILKYSPFILSVAIIGAIFSFLRALKGGIILFLWSLVSFLFYSTIPYKTPWCALNFHLPLILLAGVGMDNLINLPNMVIKNSRVSVKNLFRLPLVLLIVAGIYWEVDIALRLNFEDYDRRRENPLAYGGQTYREFMNIFKDIDRVAECSGLGKEIPIAIHKKVKNPTRWYLREYRKWKTFHRIDWESIKDDDPALIISLHPSSSKLNRQSGNLYRYREYPFYMSKKSALMVKRELAERCFESGRFKEYYRRRD